MIGNDKLLGRGPQNRERRLWRQMIGQLRPALELDVGSLTQECDEEAGGRRQACMYTLTVKTPTCPGLLA